MHACTTYIRAINGSTAQWGRCRGWVPRRRRSLHVCEMVFEVVHVDVPQCTANGRLTRHVSACWLKRCQQQWRMAVHPLRQRTDTALLAQYGARNHAQKKGPFQPFATGAAGIRYGSERIEQGANTGGGPSCGSL